MALEFSEIATLGCLFFSERELLKASTDLPSLVAFTQKVRDKVKSDSNVKFGTGKQQFIDAMDPSSPVVLDDMCKGISAAIAIKKWLTSVHNEPNDVKIKKGYMTGNVWPSPVNKLKIDAFGMADYNSSDFILYTGNVGQNQYYYGVSLKKKKKEHDDDPTLINKAFDTVMVGREFDKLKEEIRKLRVKWFADKVREAHKKKLIIIETAHQKLSDEKLILAKPAGSPKESYPNLKGTIKEGYGGGTSFRKWMNNEVGSGDLYSSMLKVIEPHMELFANSLINLILKVNLSNKLNANRDLDKYYFGFALVTGVGQMRKETPYIGKGAVYPQESVLCALAELARSKQPYTMVQVPNPAGDESNAAKVFFEIRRGRIPIIQLQIRYKGSFTAQPQFFAFLSPEFKKIIKGKSPNLD